MFDLHGKVAVVTGASVGLGRGFAFAMARQGADVAILARRKEKLDQVAEEVRSLGVKCLPVKCDVNDLEEVKAALDTVLAEFGKVDILINNAGGGTSMPILEMTDEAYFKDINTDLLGLFKCLREFGKVMVKQGHGRIINIASILGLVGENGVPVRKGRRREPDPLRCHGARHHRRHRQRDLPGLLPVRIQRPGRDGSNGQLHLRQHSDGSSGPAVRAR